MEVSVENLTKSYGFQKAVDNISFKVNTGEIVGFLGPNGAGKTTTMKIITCFMGAHGGDVKVGGISVTANPEEVKRHIGYLPETNPLYRDMPVIDYLQFAAELQNVPKSRIHDRIFEMVTICGLKAEKYKKINELSKGYQQRVGLAQALIHDPLFLHPGRDHGTYIGGAEIGNHRVTHHQTGDQLADHRGQIHGGIPAYLHHPAAHPALLHYGCKPWQNRPCRRVSIPS